MHYRSNNCSFDRVSGADEEEDMLIIPSDRQHIMNAHSDTNTDNDIVSEKVQTKDQKQIISDTLSHSRQETIRSYAIWLTNDNSVDR